MIDAENFNRKNISISKYIKYLHELNSCVDNLRIRINELREKLKTFTNSIERLKTPLATLKEGVIIEDKHFVVFNGEDAVFGYYQGDDFIEEPWPFNQEYIWWDDCDNLGIRWEEV